MKPISLAKSWLCAAVALLLVGASVQAAELRVATVDLKKVFDGYYKTKQADARLKERAQDAEKVLKGMMDDYQKANEDYKKAVESANDQAVSSDERDKRKKAAEAKLLEIKDIEQSVTQYRRTTTTTLEEQKRRMREEILRTIREKVAEVAKTDRYSLVLDTAAESINQTPILLFASGVPDITENLLKAINADAPAGALKQENN